MTDTQERPKAPTGGGGLDSFFKLSERGTTVGTEIRAGVTTFLVMAYILFVNANILGAAGFPPEAVAAGTALVAGLLTILMGVVGNIPLAMAAGPAGGGGLRTRLVGVVGNVPLAGAAGLGLSAAVAFPLVIGSGLSPAGAMGVIVLEGVAVTILVLVGAREAIMNAIPNSLKR